MTVRILFSIFTLILVFVARSLLYVVAIGLKTGRNPLYCTLVVDRSKVLIQIKTKHRQYFLCKQKCQKSVLKSDRVLHLHYQDELEKSKKT